MQAAGDAARLQAALGLERINVIRGAQARGYLSGVVVVFDSKSCDIILRGRVQMCFMPVEYTPHYVVRALDLCAHHKVIVWEKCSLQFKDLADHTLCRVTPRDLHSLSAFKQKLHNDTEDTMTLEGIWRGMRITETSIETTCYTQIIGTVVLSSAVEPMLAPLRRTLSAEVSPLQHATIPGRGCLIETTSAPGLD